MADPLQAEGVAKLSRQVRRHGGNDLVVEPAHRISRRRGPRCPSSRLRAARDHQGHGQCHEWLPVRAPSPGYERAEGASATGAGPHEPRLVGEDRPGRLRRGQPARKDPTDTQGPVSVLTAVTIEPGRAQDDPKAEGEAGRSPRGVWSSSARPPLLEPGPRLSGEPDLFSTSSPAAGQEGEIAIRPKDGAPKPDRPHRLRSRSVCCSRSSVLPVAVMVAGLAGSPSPRIK